MIGGARPAFDPVSCEYYPPLVRFDAAEKSAAKPSVTEPSAVPSTFQGSARRAFLHACRAGFVAAPAPAPYKPASTFDASSACSASNARAVAVLLSVQTSKSLRAHVAIARFLVDGLRGARSCQLSLRFFPALDSFWPSHNRGIAAFSRDGTCIYGVQPPRHTLAALRIADSAPLHTFNGLLFANRITVAPDEAVVFADDGLERIMILSRLLEPRSIILVKDHGIQRAWLLTTRFIAASDDSVAAITAAPYGTFFLSAYSRTCGALWRRVLNRRDVDAIWMYVWPCALCFLSDQRSIAVAEESDRAGVTIFSEHGDLTRRIRICPDLPQMVSVRALACSAHDQLVVALGFSGKLVFVDARSGEEVRREDVNLPLSATADPVHIDIRGTSVDVWWVGSYINPDTPQHMQYTRNLALSSLRFF